jgi:hypothetical protein
VDIHPTGPKTPGSRAHGTQNRYRFSAPRARRGPGTAATTRRARSRRFPTVPAATAMFAAGQVAHGQQVGVDAVDQRRCRGEVHGPDGAGPYPQGSMKGFSVVSLHRFPLSQALPGARTSPVLFRRRGYPCIRREGVAELPHAAVFARFFRWIPSGICPRMPTSMPVDPGKWWFTGEGPAATRSSPEGRPER